MLISYCHCNSANVSAWKSKPIKQDVVYSDSDGVQSALDKLQKLPPLVTTQEIHNLKKHLKNVALGKAFVLQGGDCAELFDYCNQDMIEAKVKLLLQMSLILIWGELLYLLLFLIAVADGQRCEQAGRPYWTYCWTIR